MPVRKEKAPKRPREDEAAATGDAKKKKKKKKRTDLPAAAGASASEHLSVAKKFEESQNTATGGVQLGSLLNSAAAQLLPKLDANSLNLDLPQILSDLQELALDPFHGIDRDAPSIARYVFLKFRSLVYQKSLPSVVPGELDSGKPTAGQPPPARDERQHSAPGSKLLKMIPRPDDPTKGGKKRIPSDRQEEMGVKKQKKIAQIKSMATEKKAGISQKPPEADPREQKEATSASAAKAEPVRKKQEPPPPKVPSPTALMMKFPPRTTLPSIASLKARFARFGPLDLAGTRVYWKSHSCKVIFKFKTDAETALNYIKNNDLFGQVKVHSYIRDVEADPSVDLSLVRPESRPAADAPPFKPPGNISSSGNGNGNGNGGGGSSSSSILGPAPSLQQARLPVTQPKSILKKPGDELGPAAGSTARDAPRVKFLLDNTGGDKAEPPSMVSGNGNGGSSTDGRASSIPSVDPPATKNNPRSVSFNTLQPPPPPLTRPSSSLPSRIPPPTQPLASAALPPRGSDGLIPAPRGLVRGLVAGPSSQAQLHHDEPFVELEDRNKQSIDFSLQMMSLLRRCSEVVGSVVALGHMPYRPL